MAPAAGLAIMALVAANNPKYKPAIAKASASAGLPAVPWATIGSALLFALVHVEPVRIPVLLTIGLVLSVLRARTGRVGASIIAHSINNLIAVAGLLTGVALT